MTVHSRRVVLWCARRVRMRFYAAADYAEPARLPLDDDSTEDAAAAC